MGKKHHHLRDQASVLALLACSHNTFPDVTGKGYVEWLTRLIDHITEKRAHARKIKGFGHRVAVAVRRNNPRVMDEVLLDYGFLDDIPAPSEHEGDSGNAGA